MTTATNLLGRYGEDVACDYLERHSFKIVDRNWRCSSGELDIIALSGSTLVFVEVKTRSFGQSAFEAIDRNKLRRLRQLAGLWCQTNRPTAQDIRIDAVSVLVRAGNVTIEHLESVF
jgi:putative endonuclease